MVVACPSGGFRRFQGAGREGSAIAKRQSYIAQSWDRLGYSSERRQACRYSVSAGAAFLGWWEQGEFRTVKALLQDLSLEGARIIVEQAPPAEGSVWVCLDGAPPNSWVEGEVIEIQKYRRRSHVVRLRFRENCPIAFFNAATHQVSEGADLNNVTDARFNARHWR